MYGPGRRNRFSRREIADLVASIVALTVAFLLVLPDMDPLLFSGDLDLGPILTPRVIGTAVGVVVTGFLFHELAHKFVAQMYGHWSEFRASYSHLGLAVVGATFGFLFAAPGAVNIVGNVSEKENGVISAVGPLANIGMAALFIVLWQANLRDPLWGFVFNKAAFFNIFLAGFNLVPVRPLDGSKVVRWNAGIYVFLWLIIVFQAIVLFHRTFGVLL